MDLPGFTEGGGRDRDVRASGKNKGGGMILLVNNKWGDSVILSSYTVRTLNSYQLLCTE